MPIAMFVAPVEGAPQWWIVTDFEGLSFDGAFPWSERSLMPDEVRFDMYRVAYREEKPTWREANRDEAVCVLWDAVQGG